eukprot:7685044-Lingulodinium_polyedra.AAC.1
MQAAAESLGLLWLFPSLYVVRHGGASRDAAGKLRDLTAIQKRGRWASLASIRHYERHARVQWILHRMGPTALALARE